MDYKKKYFKYKEKYLKLKQKGGSGKTLEFDLTFMIPFLKRLINEFDLEFQFNFIINETDNNLYIEIIKGISDMSRQTIFQSTSNFGYLKAHTHFSSYAKENSWKYAPPSAADYQYILKHYFRYFTKKQIVFSPEGIWTIELSDNFKWDKKLPSIGWDETVISHIKEQLKFFKQARKNFDSFMITGYFSWVLDKLSNLTNDLHKRLTDDPKLDKTIYPTISLEEYLDKINNDGLFIVTFQKWEEIKDLRVNIDISCSEYLYVNNFVKNKDKLYKDKKVILNQINSSNLDEIFTKLKEAPEGTEIIF